IIASATFVTPDASWTALHTVNGGTNYNFLHRQARSGEPNDVAGYTFAAEPPGQPLEWAMLVYRGAANAEDAFSDIQVHPYACRPDPGPRGALAREVAIAAPDPATCQMSPASDGRFTLPGESFYEAALPPCVASGERSITCSSPNPAGVFALRLD